MPHMDIYLLFSTLGMLLYLSQIHCSNTRYCSWWLFLLKAQRRVDSSSPGFLQMHSAQRFYSKSVKRCCVASWGAPQPLRKEKHLSPGEGPTSKFTPLEGCPTVNTLRNLCTDRLLACSFRGRRRFKYRFFMFFSGHPIPCGCMELTERFKGTSEQKWNPWQYSAAAVRQTLTH